MASRIGGWLFTAAAIVCLGVALRAAPADAASLVCRQLEAKLAATPRHGGNAQMRRFDRAVKVQQMELAKARDEARRTRCGFAVFGRNVGLCASLNATIERMEDNLATLGRQREAMARGIDPEFERARLLASIATNRCRDEQPEQTARTSPRTIDARTGLEIDRQAESRQETLRDPPSEITSSTNRVVIRGSVADADATYRTMCVRACDGYYFPMSYGVRESHFAPDESACHQRCPGAEIDLYYQDVDGDDPDAMMSVANGTPYRQMQNAYLYRTEGRPDAAVCGCNASPGLAAAAQGNGSGGDSASGSFIVLGSPSDSRQDDVVRKDISIPPLRIGPGKMNATTGETDAESAEAENAEPASKSPPREPDRDRAVRVVGPKFLPDPSAAINLQAPVPPRDR